MLWGRQMAIWARILHAERDGENRRQIEGSEILRENTAAMCQSPIRISGSLRHVQQRDRSLQRGSADSEQRERPQVVTGLLFGQEQQHTRYGGRRTAGLRYPGQICGVRRGALHLGGESAFAAALQIPDPGRKATPQHRVNDTGSLWTPAGGTGFRRARRGDKEIPLLLCHRRLRVGRPYEGFDRPRKNRVKGSVAQDDQQPAEASPVVDQT